MKRSEIKLKLQNLIGSMRGSWGSINPITKIIPDKKKEYKRGKLKHKKDNRMVE
jgi:hypothetical protein